MYNPYWVDVKLLPLASKMRRNYKIIEAFNFNSYVHFEVFKNYSLVMSNHNNKLK
ncbi:hypothetical protein FP74_gp095 [Bacillus phage CAM003]|uniref:Uncharacterized protein n=1 Tax=Bacillus phage CAM003 TaxID=1486657 RepID=A0A024B0N3_9CAUD|nr:hypothetical protein FP74_gp095 [Bacillus phage CAM003]AHZ09701.1 hypothetical protein [Bacillus phage CAM003]